MTPFFSFLNGKKIKLKKTVSDKLFPAAVIKFPFWVSRRHHPCGYCVLCRFEGVTNPAQGVTDRGILPPTSDGARGGASDPTKIL
jgi:hypothetical protein